MKLTSATSLPLKSLLTLCLLGLSSSAYSAALQNFDAPTYDTPTQVQLTHHDIRLEYSQPVRLERVLADATQQDLLSVDNHSYHEGYRLFDVSKQPQTDELYTSVRERLTVLAQDSDYQTIASSLLRQLKQHQYGYRLVTNLDRDVLRLDNTLNPLLPGQYELALNGRPSTVSLFGVPEQQSLRYHAGWFISDYLKQAIYPRTSRDSFAWLIQPDGTTEKVGIAYWNNQHVSPLPGGTIFIGFDSGDEQLTQLEQDIATLISMVKN